MAFVIADRVRETTTTTGTGSVTLAGAYISFQSFSAAIGNGNSTYYTIANPSAGEWEVGIGTYTSGTNTLSRDTVLASSASGAKVTLSSGSKDVFVTQPAERSLLVQSAGSGLFAGNAAFTANGVLYADSTTTTATGSTLTFNGTTLSTNGLTATGTTTLSGGTANGVAYLNGSKVVTTGSALTFDGTNFGLGVASPANYTNYRNLALSGTTGANIDLLSGATKVGNIFNDGTNFYLYNVTAGSVVFGVNNTEAMRLTSTGLGIGTSSPLEKLQVNGAILTTGSLSAVRTSAASLDFLSGNTRFISMGADASTKGGFIWYNSTNAAVTEGMRLDTSGNLGLGGTSSSSGITIAKQYGGVNITGGGGTYAQWGGGYGMFPLAGVGLGIASQAAMTFLVNNTSTQAMTLTAAGRLGLGLTSPSTLFEAYGGAAGTSSELTVGNASTAARFGVDTSNEVTVATGQAVPIKFLTSNTERARIDSSGNFGIGTSSVLSKLVVSNAGAQGLEVQPGALTYLFAYNRNTSAYSPLDIAGDYLRFSTGTGAERMRLDSSGNLGLGVTPSAWSLGKAIEISVSGNSLWAVGSSNDIRLTANAYYNGGYKYGANNFANMYIVGSGTGQHQWFTAPSGTAGNSITFTQAMTLDASGNLGVGRTNPGVRLSVAGNSDSWQLALSTNSGSTGAVIGSPAADVLAFGSWAGTERARIDSSGNLLVGTTSATGLGVGTAPVQSAGSIFSGGTNAGFAFKDRGASTFSLWYKTGGVNYFYTSGAGANVASINETTGAYTALSDVSKKKDFEESMIGLDTVMQLQPKLFRMLSDEDTAPKQLGFIAQDVKSVLPQAYVEQKDEDNTFIGLQDRPFIAALVKAIQEQQTLITQLTERITALEFK